MPRLSELYPSKYLSAGDLDDDGIIVTIRSIDVEKMRDGTDKPVLYFDEIEKGLALNKTNAKTIEKMYGDDTDNWEDERVTLFPSEVVFNGENVACIRVKAKKPKPVLATAAADEKAIKTGKAPKLAPLARAEDDDDEDTPF